MEESKGLEIKWHKEAILSLRSAYLFILEDSPANAEKVRNDIFESIALTAKYPELHPPDKFKIENQGDFRAFEIHNYRISYRFTNSDIRVLRIRHVKMVPKAY